MVKNSISMARYECDERENWPAHSVAAATLIDATHHLFAATI